MYFVLPCFGHRPGAEILGNAPADERLPNEQADIQASILMSTTGFNLPNLTRRIEQLPVGQMFQIRTCAAVGCQYKKELELFFCF